MYKISDCFAVCKGTQVFMIFRKKEIAGSGLWFDHVEAALCLMKRRFKLIFYA